MANQIRSMIALQAQGKAVGIYSVCSANEYVLRSALRYGREHHIPVLIEATANQINQFGGYTGMVPQDFADWIRTLAQREGMPMDQVILGGDHLGPLVWAKESPEEAMEKAEVLVADFVKAGFRKIHIDTSMPLGDDMESGRFCHELVAQRSARLGLVCRKALEQMGAEWDPVYVVGSEVPTPGGAFEDELTVTSPEQFRSQWDLFQRAWAEAGATPEHIVGFVVQPGVEFTNTTVHYYDRGKAERLCQAGREYPQMVFEGHSTDYQSGPCLRRMVEDGIGILKVGPGLTNRAREAFFALENIAREMPGVTAVPFRQILEKAMRENDGYWKKYYTGAAEEIAFQLCYGMSDRCRYYFSQEEVAGAMGALIDAFGDREIPLQLISQYLPMQLSAVQAGALEPKAEALLLDRIADCYRLYHAGCGPMEELNML